MKLPYSTKILGRFSNKMLESSTIFFFNLEKFPPLPFDPRLQIKVEKNIISSWIPPEILTKKFDDFDPESKLSF